MSYEWIPTCDWTAKSSEFPVTNLRLGLRDESLVFLVISSFLAVLVKPLLPVGAAHPGGTDAAHGTLLALRGTHQVTLVTVSPHCLLSRAVTTSILRLRPVTEPPTCLSHFQVAGVVLGGTSAGPGPVRPFSVNWTWILLISLFMNIPIPESFDFTANLFLLISMIKVPKQLILTRLCVTASTLTEVRPTVPTSVTRLRLITQSDSELCPPSTGLGALVPVTPVWPGPVNWNFKCHSAQFLVLTDLVRALSPCQISCRKLPVLCCQWGTSGQTPRGYQQTHWAASPLRWERIWNCNYK